MVDTAPGQYPWHKEPKARALLASITEDDIGLVVHTPVVGPRRYRWVAGEKHEALDALRTASMEKRHGTFNEAWARGGEAEAHKYLAIAALYPDTDDVLEAKFGNPLHLFGTAPTLGGATDANIRWDAIRRARKQEAA